jgi:hypothetical protein
MDAKAESSKAKGHVDIELIKPFIIAAISFPLFSS